MCLCVDCGASDCPHWRTWEYLDPSYISCCELSVYPRCWCRGRSRAPPSTSECCLAYGRINVLWSKCCFCPHTSPAIHSALNWSRTATTSAKSHAMEIKFLPSVFLSLCPPWSSCPRESPPSSCLSRKASSSSSSGGLHSQLVTRVYKYRGCVLPASPSTQWMEGVNSTSLHYPISIQIHRLSFPFCPAG